MYTAPSTHNRLPPRQLKVVSSENYGGSKIGPFAGYWPGTWCWALFKIFSSPSSLIEHISVSGQLIGAFCNNRRRAVNRCCAAPILLFPLCCATTIGPAIRTLPIGEAQQKKKIHENFLLALQIRPVLPIGAADIHCFTYKCRMPRSANIISYGCYIVPILLALGCSYCFTYSSRTCL
jgi:hypothetical protein